MARRRYVPKTYNNRRLLRIITSAAITIALAFAISFLILFLVLQNYVYEGELYIPWLMEEGEQMPTPRPETPPSPAPDYELSPAPVPDDDFLASLLTDDNDDATDDYDPNEGYIGPERYTVPQIQEALLPQFMASAFGERNPQVIDALRVMRDRDSIRLDNADPEDPPIDLTNTTQYKVEFRFDQPIEEYEIWLENHPNADDRPFRREDDYTVMTDYFYFNDNNGTPVLAFIRE